MPDWCFNIIEARGQEAEIGVLREASTSPTSALDFERLDPTPAELLGKEPEPGVAMVAALCGAAETEDPRSWRCAHWGCSWSPARVRVAEGDGCVMFSFDTPWSPPIGIVATLAARFPVLTFHLAFYQPARGFAGAIDFEGACEVAREELEGNDVDLRRLLNREFGEAEAAELSGADLDA